MVRLDFRIRRFRLPPVFPAMKNRGGSVCPRYKTHSAHLGDWFDNPQPFIPVKKGAASSSSTRGMTRSISVSFISFFNVFIGLFIIQQHIPLVIPAYNWLFSQPLSIQIQGWQTPPYPYQEGEPYPYQSVTETQEHKDAGRKAECQLQLLPSSFLKSKL